MTRYDYLRKYASEHAWSPSTSPETIEHARAAIHAIQNKQEVSISMLESVVSLTYYFGSFTGLLNDPALIQHCVICLCQRERKGAQVFDDEWGYLCFRILVLAINASMISKYHHPAVWDTLLSMHGRQGADEQLSDSLNAFLAQQVHNPHPDRIIGWSPQGIHPTIISKANTLLLLDLLFKDRKGLLRAWSETRSPTLTGLLFVLWRFAHVASMPNHWISFIDLARRNYLITKADFSNAIQTFQEDAHQHVDIWFSRRTLTAVDLEDARLQLSILTKRLRSEPSTGICVVPFTLSFYFLVGFSLPNADEKFIPGVEDLFIPLLREAFGGFWCCFKIGVASLIIRPDLIRKRIGLLIITINLMLDHLEIHPTDLVSRK
ncbi:hypothetical protein B0J17DRAFT_241733 [Rhizoctonia solani]|nr:hypothetical protein B0J17DRAFT_241733 [Rhizoctonia solani]